MEYIGGFLNNLFSGYCFLKIYNEFQYQGEVSEGKIQGKGKLVDNKQNVFEGQFFDGNLNGQGKKILANGDEFIGEFKNNKPNGYCEHKSPDGS